MSFHGVWFVTHRVPVAERLNHTHNSFVRPTFVYDGDCAFCSACVRFIDRRIHTPVRIEAWQRLDLGSLGLTVDECADAVQWAGEDGEIAAGPAAIARLLRQAVGASGRLVWRPAGAVLGTRPVLSLAWPAYRLVARNRHRLPGGTAACALPRRDAVNPASPN